MHEVTAISQFLNRELTRQKVLTAAEDDDDDLLVINDADGNRILMDLWNLYVSEHNFSKYPSFMKKVDKLLYAARGNRAFTHEERAAAQQAEEANPTPRRGKKRKKATPTPSPAPQSSDVTAMQACITASLAAA